MKSQSFGVRKSRRRAHLPGLRESASQAECFGNSVEGRFLSRRAQGAAAQDMIRQTLKGVANCENSENAPRGLRAGSGRASASRQHGRDFGIRGVSLFSTSPSEAAENSRPLWADPLLRGCGQTISCAPKLPHRPLFFCFSRRARIFDDKFMPEVPLA